jgi:hypothetical protein
MEGAISRITGLAIFGSRVVARQHFTAMGEKIKSDAKILAI